MTAPVQIFERRNDETVRLLSEPASKKRQGTKSREVGYRQRSERYEDCMSASLSMVGATPARRDVHVGMQGNRGECNGHLAGMRMCINGRMGNDGRHRVATRRASQRQRIG
jgi:hypothetical protein